MELDKLWNWQKKKLACRIRPENGNPAGDSLREMFVELAGVDLNELLNEMKQTKKKKEQANKVLIDHEGNKVFNEVLYRSRVLGATRLALDEMQKYDEEKSASLTQKNIRKQFTLLPKSPPKRVLMEMQRERSKPLRLPDQDEKNAATAKLEKKLAKQRAARMAAIEQSTKSDEDLKSSTLNDSQLSGVAQQISNVFPKYDGDQFSTGGFYLDGMLYLSRMADSSIKTKKLKNALTDAEMKKQIDTEMVEAEQKKKKENAETDASDKLANKDVVKNSAEEDMNAKLTCALSLCNWSRNPANASRLANEGTVRAIIQLSLESSPRIQFFCVAAFRYMSEQPELAVSMIDEGAIATISELCSTKTDEFTVTNLAISLVNLTRINGREGQLVGEAAIVLALTNIIMLRAELGVICVRGLYNLTCVDISYQFIERVIRALVSLSLAGAANVKHLCAAALCNLSDLKSVRARMVEEGVINVLTVLSRGAETRTRRVCAVILQNLSAAKSVRVEMASRNSVTAAYGLSSDQDPIILRCIGLTLSRLAMEPSNVQRIIFESGIAALCNIAVKYPTIPGISQPVASAFQLLSSHQPYRVSLASEGSVTAIASLLLSSADIFTLQHSLLALCNLLCEQENHLPIIQQGLIMTLISMCSGGGSTHSNAGELVQENDLIKDFCSLAFLNLSCSPDSRKHIVNAGAITAIISVAKQSSEVTKRRCAATLCNISYFSAGMGRMVSDGIIPSIVSLVLAKDMDTVHYSCAALCHLCCTIENAKLILESGAVKNLVHGALEGDSITKQYCGAVLSSLSFYEAARVTLCELGAIAALKGLAELNDEVTKQRCLVAFANLSDEDSIQKKMVDEGVVSIIAELANSNQEINYICCAKAICNLAFCPTTKLSVATEGGVHALLMISMVKSVDRVTKLLCVMGLNNLLDSSTIKFMLNEGLIGSIANLSKLSDVHISNLSAGIFNQLSRYSEARVKMTERAAALSALLKLADSHEAETQIVAVRTCCNLVLDYHIRGAAIKAGVYSSLEKGLMLHDRSTVHQCLVAIFSVCSEDLYMEQLAKNTHIPVTLIKYISNPEYSSVTPEEYALGAKSLSMISWCTRSRLFLQTKEVLTLLIALVDNGTSESKLLSEGSGFLPNEEGDGTKDSLLRSSTEWIASTFRYLLLGYGDESAVDELIEMGILRSLDKINKLASADDAVSLRTCKSLVAGLRTLVSSGSPAAVATIAQPSYGMIAILSRAAELNYEDKELMCDCAVTLYLFSSSSPASRANSACSETVLVLHAISVYTKCPDLLAVTIGTYLSDSKWRQPFANATVASIILSLIDSNPPETVLSNLVLAVYSMTKILSIRTLLQSAPLYVDRVLLKLQTSTDPVVTAKIKANIVRAQKNLNSDVNEAIEEGAVATLIAMSLEGKLKNQASDEYIQPVMVPQVGTIGGAKLAPPTCSEEVRIKEITDSLWFQHIVVSKGGAAGKGPEPPEPPSMTVDGSQEYPNMAEEVDGGEVEGKTKMAFAKMQVPYPFKEQFLLTDDDFKVKSDKDEEETEGMSNSVASQDSDATSLNGPYEEATGSPAAATMYSPMASAGGGSRKSSRATTPVGGGSPSSRQKKTKGGGGDGADSYSAGEEGQPPPSSSKVKSRSHSRKSISKAKEADAALNNASGHSIGSSMQSSISSVNPHHANQSSPQPGKTSGGGGGIMSEQAARLGLYA